MTGAYMMYKMAAGIGGGVRSEALMYGWQIGSPIDQSSRMAVDDTFEVVASSGSMRSPSGITMPHRWTDEGVVVETEFTGAHLYHLSAAACVLNDVYRESMQLGIVINGVRVSARGGFHASTWGSTGVTYDVEIDSDSSEAEVARLIEIVDDVAEIPRALRSGTTVQRRPNHEGTMR